MTRTFDPPQLALIDFSAFPQTQEFPAMQFYPKEWITGEATRAMNPLQRGGFIDLLAEAWDQKPPCSLPNDADQLANLSRISAQSWTKFGPLILRHFVKCADGRLRNPKQVAVWIGMMELRQKRRNSRYKRDGFVSTNEGDVLTPLLTTATADAEATATGSKEKVESFELLPHHREWAAENAPSVPPDEELAAWKDRMRGNGYRTNQGPVKNAQATFYTAMRNAEKWGSYTKRDGNRNDKHDKRKPVSYASAE